MYVHNGQLRLPSQVIECHGKGGKVWWGADIIIVKMQSFSFNNYQYVRRLMVLCLSTFNQFQQGINMSVILKDMAKTHPTSCIERTPPCGPSECHSIVFKEIYS